MTGDANISPDTCQRSVDRTLIDVAFDLSRRTGLALSNPLAPDPTDTVELGLDMLPARHRANSAQTRAAPEEWDAFLAAHPFGHHEQCSDYGIIRADYGFTAERLCVREGSHIAGGAQLLVRSTPIGRLATIWRGPLARQDDPGIMQQVVEALDRWASARRYASVRVETFDEQSVARELLQRAGFRTDMAWTARSSTLVIPLAWTDDEILAQAKQKWRYNIRLAQRSGVTVACGSLDDIADFHRLHVMSASHQDFPVLPFRYFEAIWRLFGKAARLRVFLAYHDAQPLAAILNTVVGSRMLYGWGGVHRGTTERKLMANYLLHFEAMRYARAHGCTLYDFGGVSPERRVARGVSEFKRGFGGVWITGPSSLRKLYGPFRQARRAVMEHVWARPLLRRGVTVAARRLGIQRTMPW